ncbi:MAG: hypothetical protein KF745_07295 [Phycisphaeraceae bacterium]|nr:hypothetical protein [Phycisphaeraceae bacterium]
MRSTPEPDIAKSALLASLGFGGGVSLYDPALETAGLSRPAKPRISTSKHNQVAALLAEKFMRVCSRGDCSAKAPAQAAGRAIVPASTPAFCEVCGGSVNRAAVSEMVAACQRAGWRRLCILGGSPASREEIDTLAAGRLELRLIDGTRSASHKDAAANIAWADRVVIWGSTELAHKVSALYKGPNVITAARRGVADLTAAVIESARRSDHR